MTAGKKIEDRFSLPQKWS